MANPSFSDPSVWDSGFSFETALQEASCDGWYMRVVKHVGVNHGMHVLLGVQPRTFRLVGVSLGVRSGCVVLVWCVYANACTCVCICTYKCEYRCKCKCTCNARQGKARQGNVL